MNTLNISKRAAGKAGEDYAAKMLEASGCRILCRNYTGLNGEIDIIAEGRSIYFIYRGKTAPIFDAKTCLCRR